MDLPDGRTLHVYDTAVVTAPWRFDPAAVRVPVLLVHGGQDRVAPSSHGRLRERTSRG